MTYSKQSANRFRSNSRRIIGIVLLALAAISVQHVSANNFDDEKELNIFIDCSSCDTYFIRDQINYVNHVRDQAVADVFIFINSSTTGSGGRLYELDFKGLKELVGIDNKFEVSFAPTATSDDHRKGLLKKIELGLVSYLIHSNVSEDMKVNHICPRRLKKQPMFSPV